MKKHETASAYIRIFPSDHARIKAIAEDKKEDAPGNVTPADVVHEAINKAHGISNSTFTYVPGKGKKAGNK